jgi:transposase
MLSKWRSDRAGLGISPTVHELREIVNAIWYVNRTGVQWEYLPHDFPPYKTVYGYFSAWSKDGTAEKIHDMLRAKVRQAAGRAGQPSAAILDAQSVKTSSNVSESTQGIDAGKKIKGRKRHIVTDTLGLLLVVLVTAASVQDATGGVPLIEALATTYPSVTKAWVDSGYKRSVVEKAAANNIDVEVVTKDPDTKGFSPTVRWPVERTFGWLMLHRRLARDYEADPEHSRTMIHWAMIDNMAKRLTGETTQTWRDPIPKTDKEPSK